MNTDIETTEIFKTAKKTIEQFYNNSCEEDLLAKYIAEDISLAVVAVYGKGNKAKYLLDAISNRVQSWCNPALDDSEENNK